MPMKYFGLVVRCMLIILLCGICNTYILAQEIGVPIHYDRTGVVRMYIVLDKADFPIHHVRTQRSGSSEIASAEVELYNLLFAQKSRQRLPPELSRQGSDKVLLPTDTLLITLSVLSDEQGRIHWYPVRLDSIPAQQQLSFAALVRNGYQLLQANEKLLPTPWVPSRSLPRRRDIYPVVKRDGRYWTTDNYVLTEYFRVRVVPKAPLWASDNVTINYRSQVFSKEVIRARRLLEDGLEERLATRYVLGGKIKGAYAFWSRPFAASHAGLMDYGVGEFMYKPGIGLISGKYYVYFELGINDQRNAFFDVLSIDGKPIERK